MESSIISININNNNRTNNNNNSINTSNNYNYYNNPNKNDQDESNLFPVENVIKSKEPSKQFTIHIAVIGKKKSGKSSLIRCYLKKSFTQEKEDTTLDIFAKKIKISGQEVNLIISELSQEKKDIELTKEILKIAHIVFICYNLEDDSEKFLEEINEGKFGFINEINKDCYIYLVGCKFDLVKNDQIEKIKIIKDGKYSLIGENIVKMFESNEKKFEGYYITSAMLNLGIFDLFHDAIKLCALPYVYQVYLKKEEKKRREMESNINNINNNNGNNSGNNYYNDNGSDHLVINDDGDFKIEPDENGCNIF